MTIGHIIVFAIVILSLLIADFVFVGKKSHRISTREAGIWTAIFILVSLLFGGFIYETEGKEQATAFITAYTIEKVLSVDNLFVFVMVFKFFQVNEKFHHKVLFWGVLGAIVMRAIFIFAGIGLVKILEFEIFGLEVNILIVAFGLFLLYAGMKTGIDAVKGEDDEDKDYSKSPGARFIKFIFRGNISEYYDGDKFFTVQSGIKYATPLLIVVGVVEFTDLLFAVDSIPAIFAVSKDPFILYTSNIFAILGLRSMYFLLANMLPLFTYLKHGLGLILSFIGFKMIVSPLLHIDSGFSLIVVLVILITSVGVSLIRKPATA